MGGFKADNLKVISQTGPYLHNQDSLHSIAVCLNDVLSLLCSHYLPSPFFPYLPPSPSPTPILQLPPSATCLISTGMQQ